MKTLKKNLIERLDLWKYRLCVFLFMSVLPFLWEVG